MNTVQTMYNHFSKVASYYRDVRITDVEPIVFIAEILKNLNEIRAADVGCGTGRYDLLLFKHLNSLHLACIDINESMLEQASEYLTRHGITNFITIRADADDIPLEDNSMNCIFTFNAIHHFNFFEFLEKSCRVIKEDGKIFIYTRLKSQNNRSIWGKYFPLFSEREDRLYELEELEQLIHSIDSLRLETAKSFKYRRNASINHLVEKVKARHYSTFSLYQEDEFDVALTAFQEKIRRQIQDTNEIEWFDENILLILKPK